MWRGSRQSSDAWCFFVVTGPIVVTPRLSSPFRAGSGGVDEMRLRSCGRRGRARRTGPIKSPGPRSHLRGPGAHPTTDPRSPARYRPNHAQRLLRPPCQEGRSRSLHRPQGCRSARLEPDHHPNHRRLGQHLAPPDRPDQAAAFGRVPHAARAPRNPVLVVPHARPEPGQAECGVRPAPGPGRDEGRARPEHFHQNGRESAAAQAQVKLERAG